MSRQLTAGVLGRSRLLPQTRLYRDRVISDTGEIISLSDLNKQIKREVDADNYENLLLWVDSNAGLKLVGDNIEKAYDISVNNNDATQTTPDFQPLLVNSGMEFNGLNDVLDCGTNFNITNKLTLGGWVNLYSYTTFPRILGAEEIWIIYIRATLEIRWFGSGTDASISSSPINLNQFTHILVTYDGNTIRCYINGVLDGAISSLTGNLNSIGTTPVTIGNRSNSDRPLDGILNDVRVYDKVLSAAEINKIYNDTKGRYGI